MDTVALIRAGVRDEGLLQVGKPVLVLLSGGRDSTCLLDAAVAVAGAGAVAALHVNYALRPAAGDEERHCEQLCAELGVNLDVFHAPATPSSGNLEAWARELRYEAAKARAGTEVDIAVAHTASDQVETILYRLASSPSRRALLGMRARSGTVVRPLLGFTREQTTRYCRERGLAWRDDESNLSPQFARNRVRHQLLPALQAVHPGATANVLALAATLRDEAEVLDELVEQALAGADTIPLVALRALPAGVGRLVVQRLADGVLGAPAPGAARRLEEILALSDRGRAALDLPHGVRASVHDGVLSFGRTPPHGRRPRRVR
jgi:tRNA(Ile)-lysidine synthase